MTNKSLHDNKLNFDDFTIPFFCILLSIFIYMIYEYNSYRNKTNIRRDLYVKV